MFKSLAFYISYHNKKENFCWNRSEHKTRTSAEILGLGTDAQCQYTGAAAKHDLASLKHIFWLILGHFDAAGLG